MSSVALDGQVVLLRCTNDGVRLHNHGVCFGGSSVAGVSCCRNVSGAGTECKIFEEIEVDFVVEGGDLSANGNNIASFVRGNGRHILQTYASDVGSSSTRRRLLRECIPKDQTYEEVRRFEVFRHVFFDGILHHVEIRISRDRWHRFCCCDFTVQIQLKIHQTLICVGVVSVTGLSGFIFFDL